MGKRLPHRYGVSYIVMVQVGDYEMGNVSILIHRFGASAETGGVFTMRNRMMGQVDVESFGARRRRTPRG